MFVNNRNCSTAWNTTMPPPFMVRAPETARGASHQHDLVRRMLFEFLLRCV